MENENDKKDEIVNEEKDLEDNLENLDDLVDDEVEDWKAKANELKGIAKRRNTQLEKIKNKLLETEKKLKDFESKEKSENKPKPSTDELNDTQLDYLDLKGINEDEDIEIIKQVMLKTGQTVRQVLKDNYVISKLQDLKQAREVKNATPSGKRGAGNQINDSEDYWFQKYEATGKLPENMPSGMATKLVNRKSAQTDAHRNPYE